MTDNMQRAREFLAAEYDRSGSSDCAAEIRSGDIDGAQYMRAITAALRAAPDGFVLVPVEPTQGVLVSMAIRRDHGLGCPNYYDSPVFGADNVGHKRRMEVAIIEARQQYEEVVGRGFYRIEIEE